MTSDSPFPSAAILGTGSFGTAMAILLAPKLGSITLIGRDPATAESINKNHKNPQYLSDFSLPENLRATTSLSEAGGHPLLIFAIPTSAIRNVATALRETGIPRETVLLSCTKGIEKDTGGRMTQILRQIFPGNPIAALSGPNHAEEIAAGLPTCAVIGSEDDKLACRLQDLFTFSTFRSYTSNDLPGIEFGGAVKNVYAIAAGMALGLGVGDNAVAALVTRALAEMTRLGTALGGRPETFAGLSGVGDLFATCFSRHSRNHRVGLALGKGKTLAEAVDSLGMVAEGVPNSLSIHDAARRAGVRTPLIDGVYEILYQDKPVARAMEDLLNRDPRPETG